MIEGRARVEQIGKAAKRELRTGWKETLDAISRPFSVAGGDGETIKIGRSPSGCAKTPLRRRQESGNARSPGGKKVGEKFVSLLDVRQSPSPAVGDLRRVTKDLHGVTGGLAKVGRGERNK